MAKDQFIQKLKELHGAFLTNEHWHEQIPGPIGILDNPDFPELGQEHVPTYMIPLKGDSMALTIHALMKLVDEKELIKILEPYTDFSWFELIDTESFNLRTCVLTDGTLLKICHDKIHDTVRTYVDEICIDGERYRIRTVANYQSTGE